MIITPSPEILLIGAGQMAVEYARVLQALKKKFLTIGRSEKSVIEFEKATSRPAIPGGIHNWLNKNRVVPETAIVATDETMLGPITRLLINHGVRQILVEKPGGLNLADLSQTRLTAKKHQAGVFIAYNRRFFASTIKAGELIKKDGGVKSFNFDFTERSHLIEKLNKPPVVKKEWLLANSSHVIDLAFFLGGKPKKINTYTAGDGGLAWHPQASIFTGSGLSQNRALFSYHADWQSAGRWAIEIVTPKQKLIFRPLEKLQKQKFGKMEIEEIKLNDELDHKFKPGLYRLTQSFLTTKNNLPTIDEQIENLKYYKKIEKGC